MKDRNSRAEVIEISRKPVEISKELGGKKEERGG
jgi:hypothetical protein